jgi:hypothetical protein
LAIPVADAVMVFDNSASTGPLLRLQINANAVIHNQLDAKRRLDRRIASVVAEGLGVPTEYLLGIM